MNTPDKHQIANHTQGDHVNFNGHPSKYPNHVIERHPTMKSFAKRRIFDCKDSKIKITDWCSAGNHSIYAVINGLDCQVYQYGKNVSKSILKLNK